MPAISIDGHDFDVTDEADAVSLLRRARDVAEKQVETKSQRVEKRLRKKESVPAVTLAKPVISVPAELREATAPLIADIERLYAKASMEMELRLLLLKQQQDEDDDEDVIWLS